MLPVVMSVLRVYQLGCEARKAIEPSVSISLNNAIFSLLDDQAHANPAETHRFHRHTLT